MSRDSGGEPPPPERGRVGVGVIGHRISRFNRTPGKTEFARRLRRDGTGVERRLWQRLRNSQLGDAQFRRQHPAGRYVLDFYCPALALAVELDGGQHAEAATRDRERDRWLKQKGVTVLRFWNSDVTENLDGVLEVIAAKIGELSLAAAQSRPRWRTGRQTPTPTLPLQKGVTPVFDGLRGGSAPPEWRHMRLRQTGKP
jgi:very-short-patch-repair endonuclease